MKAQVIIEIDTNGEVKIDAVGFKGQACEKATAEMEKALGVATKRQKKPEYHSVVTAQNKQTVG